MKQNKNLTQSLMERADTAWTFAIVAVALILLLILTGLKALKIVKKHEDETAEPLD